MKAIVKKLITFAVTVLIVTLFVFVAFELIPGDAATAKLGINATPEALAALREELGLTLFLCAIFRGSHLFSSGIWVLPIHTE